MTYVYAKCTCTQYIYIYVNATHIIITYEAQNKRKYERLKVRK